jgi:hypothetical protein
MTLVMPRYFWVQTVPSREGHPGAISDPGAISESHYIVEDGTVTLTDAAGKPLPGQRHKRKLGPEDDEMVVARALLRSKSSRPDVV